MRFLRCVLVLACVLSGALPAAAQGNGVGNGGDYVSSEFIGRGFVVLRALRRGDAGVTMTDAEEDKLEQALLDTRVDPTDEMLLDVDGTPRDALALEDDQRPGHRLIRLRRDRWLEYFQGGVDVYKLVFHEYLRTIGVNDDNYRVSERLRIRNADAIEQQPAVTRLPEGDFAGSALIYSIGVGTVLGSMSTTIHGNVVTSNIASAFGSSRAALRVEFGEDGYFTMYPIDSGTAQAYGYCNAIHCTYRAESGGLVVVETFTFYDGRLYRSGLSFSPGVVVSSWVAALDPR